MLVALLVGVLVRVLAVRVRVLFYSLVTVAKVGVGESNEHQNQQDSKHADSEDPRLGPERAGASWPPSVWAAMDVAIC